MPRAATALCIWQLIKLMYCHHALFSRTSSYICPKSTNDWAKKNVCLVKLSILLTIFPIWTNISWVYEMQKYFWNAKFSESHSRIRARPSSPVLVCMCVRECMSAACWLGQHVCSCADPSVAGQVVGVCCWSFKLVTSGLGVSLCNQCTVCPQCLDLLSEEQCHRLMFTAFYSTKVS